MTRTRTRTRHRAAPIVFLATLIAWQAAGSAAGRPQAAAQTPPPPPTLAEAAARAKAAREKATTPAPVMTAPAGTGTGTAAGPAGGTAARTGGDSSSSSAATGTGGGTVTAAPAAGAAAGASAAASASAAAGSASRTRPAVRRGAPFLWRIEGPVPSYLFGTIHVPDPDVLALPPGVESAFAASRIVFTEIPMDAATQFAALGKTMLPDERRLKDIVGQPLFERLSAAVTRSLPEDSRSVLGPALIDMLNGMKPWAAMSQLTAIEFFDDMKAGRQPLDAMLYSRAQHEGKAVGALETVDEQAGVFEAFTEQEQTRMLALTLDELDEAARHGESSSQAMITGYLSGDLQALVKILDQSMSGDTALSRKFYELAVDRRNVVMVDRILARRAEQPDRVCFFAVGAGHYAGDRGILALLAQKGLKVTRISVP